VATCLSDQGLIHRSPGSFKEALALHREAESWFTARFASAIRRS